MTIERYSHVMHIVSQVVGKSAPTKMLTICCEPLFLRAPQWRAESPRSPNYFRARAKPTRRLRRRNRLFQLRRESRPAIGIRTALIKDNKIYIQSGAGIVADSIPESEFMETVNKAKAMLKAVLLADMFGS